MTKAEDLIKILKYRFENNKNRHKNIEWIDIEKKLIQNSRVLNIISEMEKTSGEPDLIKLDNVFVYCDCSAESPKDRRSLCYDQQALDSRKENKPKGNVIEMAKRIGIEILNQEQYKELQKVGEFDLKTSSWLKTPEKIRNMGGAIFGDRRYNEVFIYHNGAESYYAARGFRGFIKI